MGNAMQPLHDFFYYVLNDSECHSTCKDAECSCATHPIESHEDQFEVDVGEIHLKKT